MDYRSAGVDYDKLDAFKRACQHAAATTVPMLAAHGAAEAPGTRGESAYLMRTPLGWLAHVEEGLGTKNLVADAVATLTGKTYYDAIGIDLVATIVNDLITCGARPLSVAMHAAVGDSDWFDDEPRAAALARGFADACLQSGAVWGGGETPTLRGIVEPLAICLGGSATGIATDAQLIKGDVKDGDAIILLASTGIQTNGLTLCRKLAGKLPEGYLTPCGDQTYGEALLAPSAIYAGLVAKLQDEGIAIHYTVHVTGHGWRKLMRLDLPLVYRIENLPPSLPVFDFIAQHAGMDDAGMYGTFNMGVGFAVYVPADQAQQTVKLAEAAGHRAWHAGTVRDEGGRKAVEIVPNGVVFGGDSLAVR